MDADHQKSAFASKRGVPKCPFGELYVLHFQTDDFFKTKFCGKQEEVEQTTKSLRQQLKALVARDIWDMSQYFQIMNETNDIVQKAVELIK